MPQSLTLSSQTIAVLDAILSTAQTEASFIILAVAELPCVQYHRASHATKYSLRNCTARHKLRLRLRTNLRRRLRLPWTWRHPQLAERVLLQSDFSFWLFSPFGWPRRRQHVAGSIREMSSGRTRSSPARATSASGCLALRIASAASTPRRIPEMSRGPASAIAAF
ncbi:hypothetical protein C8F01DRAFT_719103 [Mycena amicta]|nr:hypothetical protein C8F01DRAFT_719103 [Mycena amicta]